MNRNKIIKISVALFTIAILFTFRSIPNTFDSFLASSFNKISSEIEPDSSIVIIHITSQDIEQLGPWPIKRSYYALLLNNLSSLNVKKIGIEVFLSAKFVSQAVYDNVLQKEIGRANNVVLSSLAGSLNESNDLFITDSLSFPSPKLINEQIQTGHINFIRNYGIEIPLQISNQTKVEKAFCLSLTGKNKDYPKKIKINFTAQWNKFKNYSLVEFFQLVQENDPDILQLKNKIVLVGISDSQLSSAFETNFEKQLPGVALHAFALDNLLNKRFINDTYYNWSIYAFIILVILLIIFLKNNTRIFSLYTIIFSTSLLINFLAYRIWFLELAFSFILIPIAFYLLLIFILCLLKREIN